MPSNKLVSSYVLIYFGYKVLAVGPCFLIAYACIRRRNWGRYLIIGYNGLCLTYVTAAVISEIVTNPKSIDGPIVVAILVIYSVLGSLIAFAFQRDVRAVMQVQNGPV